jgi:hypothetical protein
MAATNSGRTTVGLSRSTKTRLDELKPYDSMSYDEFLAELADAYEGDA